MQLATDQLEKDAGYAAAMLVLLVRVVVYDGERDFQSTASQTQARCGHGPSSHTNLEQCRATIFSKQGAYAQAGE
jgi:hypothetical protein